MFVERLLAHGVRNLTSVEVVPQAPTLLLQGDNGQGKTNILEALYLCTTGRSFRNATAKELVAHDRVLGRAQALISRQGVRHEVALEMQVAGESRRGRQKLTVDGRTWQRASRLLSLINVVAFFPDDLRIAKGSPEERRRFFDRAVAGGQPSFVEASLAYQRALKARNALLRASTSPTAAHLEVYDAQLVRWGSQIVSQRAEALAVLWPLADKFLRTLLGGHEAGIELVSGVRCELPAGHPDFAEAFAAKLKQSSARDRASGTTLSGPHRADLLLSIDGRSARAFASQGQQRALVLALKLAELAALVGRLGMPPILLLDDVSSELDKQRQSWLFEAVAAQGCQTWVTTTGVVELPIKTPCQRLRVEGGTIRSQ